MSAHHFALADWAAILYAFALFSLLTFFPGYALGWLVDAAQFRTRSWTFRVALSVPLSIALGPAISFLLGSWLSLRVAWILYALLSANAVVLMVRDRSSRQLGLLRPFLGIGILWILLATFMLADLQWGRRLYYPIIGFDYAVRSAFTASINNLGLPAQNPFFFPGHSVALRYHYYWMIPCAMVRGLGGSLLTARQAFIAGTLWCGLGLICLVPLYLRLFSPRGAKNLVRRSIVTIALLGVTGLDLIPALLMIWLNRIGVVAGISPSVEWWNNQVDGWLYTMLWEPHYLASVIACLTGFLIVSTVEPGSWRAAIVSGVAAGLSFATAAGSGIYVAFVFAAFLGAWILFDIVKGSYREIGILMLSGAVAFLASIPYLHGLRGPGGGGSFVQLTVRTFDPAQMLLQLLQLDQSWQKVLANAVFLPLNYSLELGFFLAAAFLCWRDFRDQKRVPTRGEVSLLLMGLTSVTICTFLKSGVIANNDLGWRGFLIAQFTMLLIAGELLAAPGRILPPNKIVLMGLLVVGVAGTFYDLGILRFYPLLSDAKIAPKIGWLAEDEQLGVRTYAQREAYEWLRTNSVSSAIVQADPEVSTQDTAFGLYADHRTAAEDPLCATAFGGDPAECAAVVQPLTALFWYGAEGPDAICQRMGIDFLVAQDTDRVWRDRSSWVWSRPPIYSNGFVRIFSCVPSPPTALSRH